MVSNLVVLLLFGLIALPGLLAVALRRATGYVVGGYVAALLLLGFLHVGLPTLRSTLPSPPAADDQGVGAGQPSPAACRMLLRQADRAQLIFARPARDSVAIDRKLWTQVPEQVQQVIESCLRRYAGAARIDIVDRR